MQSGVREITDKRRPPGILLKKRNNRRSISALPALAVARSLSHIYIWHLRTAPLTPNGSAGKGRIHHVTDNERCSVSFKGAARTSAAYHEGSVAPDRLAPGALLRPQQWLNL